MSGFGASVADLLLFAVAAPAHVGFVAICGGSHARIYAHLRSYRSLFRIYAYLHSSRPLLRNYLRSSTPFLEFMYIWAGGVRAGCGCSARTFTQPEKMI